MASNAYILKVIKGAQCEQAFPIQKKSIHLGSAYTQNDLVLNMEDISVQHAHIWCKKGIYYIENLSSDHVILINGKALKKKERTELDSDAVIDLGEVSLQFIVNGKAPIATDEKPKEMPFHLDVRKLYDRGRIYWQQLSRQKQMVIALSVVVIVFLSLIKAVNSPEDSRVEQVADQDRTDPVDLSNTPLPLPAEGIYGYIKNNDESHCDKVIFTFKTDSSNVDLYYTIGGVESEKEVVVRLNDQQISYAPLAEGAWGEETRIRLPKEYLIDGGVNQLIFDNTKNPPNKDRWAVKDVRVKILPPDLCEMTEAERYFDLGEKMNAEKAVSKGNIYFAFKYYDKALHYMQGCPVKEEIFHQAERKRKVLETAIDKTYNDLMFTFKKAVKAKDYMSGRTILQNIIQYIPDEADERHQKAAKALDVFNEALGLKED